MARRQDDSGLRAGFVRDEEPGQKNAEARGSAEAANITASQVDTTSVEASEDVALQSEQNNSPEADGPTVTMQGVSGKKITGTVKVVKVRKKKRDDQDEPSADATEDQGQPEPAFVESVDASPESEPKTEEVETPAATAKAEETVQQDETVDAADSEKPAEQQAPVAEAADEVKDDESTLTLETVPRGPRPRKLKAGDGTLPTPSPTRTRSKAAAKPAAPAPKKAVAKPVAKQQAKPVTKEVEEPVQTIPSVDDMPRPRKIGSMKDRVKKETAPKREAQQTPVAQTPEKQETKPLETRPQPRKISSGGDRPVMGRKIVSGEKLEKGDAEASLAATAKLFAARKAEREAAKERKSAERPSDQRDRGRSPGPRRGPQTFGGGGFDKDKDDDQRQRMTQSPRKPRSAPATDDLDTVLGKPAASRRKFQDGGTNRSRHREWPDQSRANRGPAGKEESRDLKERANRVSRQGLVDEFSDGRRRRRRKRRSDSDSRPQQQQQIAKLTHVKLPGVLTVKEFAEAIKKSSAEVITHLMKNGVMATANQELDFDTATIIADEFNITTERFDVATEEDRLFDDSDDVSENLESRPPVVVVMGHVDHGKTSLLDYIRKSEVTDGEAGGITQHIGAYMVTANDRKITFLDTPGHEAFTTMRARGAQATDIAILVVAADDGVMPQTVEAINHARAADTEIIVAINKIDKPAANVERVKQELSQHELISEDWGGETIMVPVSAHTGEGMDELLEMVLLTADIMNLEADPTRQAKGIIIESKLDRARGALATLLVQRGTLRQGDTIVTSSVVGNIRAMTDATGQTRSDAGPSVPVEILGLPEVPEAGELFYVVNDEKLARQLAEKRRDMKREESIGRAPKTTLESLFDQIEAGEVQDLNIIVKADVFGSAEAMTQSLEKLTNDEVRVNVIHAAAGAINESDIRLASVSNAIVIGFSVRPTAQVADLAREEGVDIRLYTVIYSAIEDVEAAMKGMLAPEYVEEVLGQVEIRDIFKVSNVGTIGGGYVTSGKILRNSDVRLMRDGVVIYEGQLGSLRRFKDDVREVNQGYECGISIERFNDIKVGDIIEAYQMKEVERT